MALDATVGGTSANSFVTVANATAYFDTRLNVSGWTDAETADKERALKSATREINLLKFLGTKASGTQALSWPRAFVENPDPSGYDDTTLPDDEIPERVQIATCELALQYILAGSSDFSAADPNAGVIQKTIGPITTIWDSPASRPTGWLKYPIIGDALGPLLDGAGNGSLWERS